MDNSGAGIVLVNNTGTDTRLVDGAIIDAIKNNAAELPEELADLFTLELVAEGRYVLDFA